MLHDIGYEQLNDVQKDVVDECINKPLGVLALLVGQGKTVCSLTLALKLVALHSLDTPILVVMSKSLLGTWVE
jgi:superfamily II DNA or RNA helicase